jgi:hypothetical protein
VLALARGRQAVGAVFRQAARSFGVVEAGCRAAPQPLHDLFRGQAVLTDRNGWS